MGDMLERLGMVFGWVWNRRYRQYDWLPLHWRAERVRRPDLAKPVTRRMGMWSGARTPGRGRHGSRIAQG